jgi:hypothetical protein
MDEVETQKMKGPPSTPVRAADAATDRTIAASEAKKTASAEPVSEVAAHAADDEATFVSPSSPSWRSARCTATR